jgi:glycerophosphoryl diester phosphodiesterase
MIQILFFLFVNVASAFDWQGHRGSRGLYPENTLGAMEQALNYPVTTLEFDVVVTKDKKVILSHEPWMNKVICLDPKGNKIRGKDFNIYQMNYQQVEQFDCGSLDHPDFPKQKRIKSFKPTLHKVITEIEKKVKSEKKEIAYNIEIKSTLKNEKAGFQPQYQEFSDMVIKELNGLLPPDRFSIQSFDWRVLKYIHQKYPQIKLVALKYGRFEVEEVISELGFKPYVFSPWFKDLTKEKVKGFQKQGIKVIPWTVNEVSDLKLVRTMNVDGIITDYPDRIEK